MMFKIQLDIYDHEIIVIFDKDIKSGVQRAERHSGKRMKAGDKYFTGIRALTWDALPQHTYIILTDKDPAVIAHESLHATWFVAERVGLNFKKDDEAQAYLLQYIMEKIIEKLK